MTKTYLIDEEVLRQVLEVIDNVIADWDDMTITPDELKAVTTLRAILASPPVETDHMKMTKEQYLEWLKSPLLT